MDIRAKVAKEKPQKSSQKKNQGKTTSSQTNDRSDSESDYYFLTSKFVAKVVFCGCEYCEICTLNIVVQ